MGAQIQRRVGGAVPRQVAFHRAPARNVMPFRPTTAAGGGMTLNSLMNANSALSGGPLGQQGRSQDYRCIGRLDPTTGQRRPCVSSQQGGLGIILTMGIDDYREKGGDGPYCENCYSDSWVIHKMRNGGASMPDCKFGVHWDEAEFSKIQQAIHEMIREFTSPVWLTGPNAGQPRVDAYGRPWQPRYPSPDEMNEMLKTFKFSRDCPNCKKLFKQSYPVAFQVTLDDVQVPGVNAPG